MKAILLVTALTLLSFGAQANSICIKTSSGVHTNGTVTMPRGSTRTIAEGHRVNMGEFHGTKITYSLQDSQGIYSEI